MSVVLAPPPPPPPSVESACLDENTALELLDGTLPTSARTNVEKHLEECDLCRELVAELAQMGRAVSQEVEAAAAAQQRPPDTVRTPFATRGVSGSSSSVDARVDGESILDPGTRCGPYRIE